MLAESLTVFNMVSDVLAFPSKSVQTLVLSQHHLTEKTLGRKKEDILKIVSDVGGLHAQSLESPYFSLWNRMTRFEWGWLDELLRQKMLVAAHLMRVTMHIVPTREFPMYFRATRDAIRKFLKNRAVPWPPEITKTHRAVLNFIEERGETTSLEIRRFLESKGLPTQNLHRIIHYELAGIGAILKSERTKRVPTQWRWSMAETLIDKSLLESVTEEDAKEWLVRKYLKAFGPSSIEDIISYTWHTKTETRRILETLTAKKEVVNIKTYDAGKLWILTEDQGKFEQLEKENSAQEKPIRIRVLPEFDPLTIGLRRRWKDLISVPPVRRGLRPHPAPGVILINGRFLGKYVVWPDLSLFFDAKDGERRMIRAILNQFEEMARLRGMNTLCLGKINRKEMTSEELKPISDYLGGHGYFVCEKGLCKQLLYESRDA